jgi:AcrR family transcriptional regulator
LGIATPSKAEGHLSAKKARTRREILANAIALFLRSGVRQATAAEIAAAAGVSVATLFNYFPTRSDLAEAWVRGELFEILETAMVAGGERGLRGTLRAVCRELAGRSSADAERRLEAWRATSRSIGEGRRPALARGLVAAIERDQEAARLRSDLEAEAIAALVVDALEAGLIRGLERAGIEGLGETVDPVELASALRRRVDLVLDGARKRNERVAPPTPARAAQRPPGAGSPAPRTRSE